jgi:hypothetical protein
MIFGIQYTLPHIGRSSLTTSPAFAQWDRKMHVEAASDITSEKKKKVRHHSYTGVVSSIIIPSEIRRDPSFRSFVSAGRRACRCDLFRLIIQNILRRFFPQFQCPRQDIFDLIGEKPCRKPCTCLSYGTTHEYPMSPCSGYVVLCTRI